jgi:hypothetical protein
MDNVVLGRTSLWLLYPLWIYLNKKDNNKKIIYIYRFTWLWSCITSIVSYLMWDIYDKKSLLLYNLDIMFARGTFILLSYIILFVHTQHIYKKTLFPIGVGVFYILTCKLYDYEYFIYATFSHLIFRYIGIWWTYIAFNQTATFNRFITLSIMYWFHILYLISIK